MTLNGVMTVTLLYFTESGKPALQDITASICGVIYARVYTGMGQKNRTIFKSI